MKLLILGFLLTACSFNEFGWKVRFDAKSSGNYCIGTVRNALPFDHYQIDDIDCYYKDETKTGAKDVPGTRILSESDVDFLFIRFDCSGYDYGCFSPSNGSQDGDLVYVSKADKRKRYVDDDKLVEKEIEPIKEAREIFGQWKGTCKLSSLESFNQWQDTKIKVTEKTLAMTTTLYLDYDARFCKKAMAVATETYSYSLENSKLKLKLLSKVVSLKDKALALSMNENKVLGISNWKPESKDVTHMVPKAQTAVELAVSAKENMELYLGPVRFKRMH